MVTSLGERWRLLATQAAAAAAIVIHALAYAQTQRAPNPIDWRSADAVRSQLQVRISVDWEDVPLSQAIATLSKSQKVSILLDRRVDPSTEFRLSLKDQPLEAVLKGLGIKHKLGIARVGPVVYLGPRETADRIQTVFEIRKQELDRLAPPLRTALSRSNPVRWEVLAEPRRLLTELGKKYQVRINGIESVPHDLWDNRELPAMSFVEQFTLIAGQFDLTFDFQSDGRTVGIVPMPESPVLEKSYTNVAGAVAKLKHLIRRSELQVVGNRLVVRGPADEHEIVEELLSGRRVSRTTVTEGKRYFPQVNAVGPAGKLIREFAQRLELEADIDEQAIRDAGLSLDKEVRVSLKDADEDDLWRAVLEPAGLAYERAGKKLTVRPAKKPRVR
jgi:hypothetical protein